ncbi:MAG: hypothetical protein KDB07_09745, partial [Planctomycetes bacterium]|nr:hypothetical protein [Planctomycetota bacterium]
MGSSRKNLAPEVTTKVPPARLRRTPRRRVGEPMVWLSGGATALGVVMIIALVGMIFAKGLATFWPQEVEVFVLGAENKDDDTLGTHLTPYQLADEQGKLVPSASALSSEASKNHKLLLGVLWKSQDLNPSLLPLNSKTRAPWGAHEIDAESLTIRIGNAGEALAPNPAIVGDDARYTKELVEGKSFVNIKANIPELDVYRESSPSGYAETVLHRQVADKWVATIDRQIDSSAYGYVVGVYDGATPLATVEKDGLERVWEVFQEHLNEAQHFLDLRREYEEERGEEIASVTNTLEDRILDLRYRHRNTPEIVTLAGRLNYLFDAWKRDQPTMGSLRFDDASFLQALSLWLPKAASAINADKALPPPPLRGELRFFDTNAWKNELSTARSEINQSEALSDLRDWVLEKAPALQSLSEDPSVDELQQVLGLASDAALMTESWLETYANTTISANDPRFAQPQALESALDEWFWPAGISGRPEIKRLPDSDIEDTLDTISKAFPSTPEALSHGTSFRHIYAQAWQEFVSTTKETKNERILTQHESDLKGLLAPYARKAVLQAIL